MHAVRAGQGERTFPGPGGENEAVEKRFSRDRTTRGPGAARMARLRAHPGTDVYSLTFRMISSLPFLMLAIQMGPMIW